MKVIIAGGGTGGHLFPAVALGEEMVRERRDTEVLYVGTSNGFEAKWLPQSGYRYELFPVHGLLGGRGALARMRSLLELMRAIRLARATLKNFGGQIVVSAGGYASAPMGIAAIVARIPLVLMEQNTTIGFSNRMLWRFADRICVGFEDAARHFGGSRKVVVTGNPVRYRVPDRKALSDSQIQILVLGGSTGAHRLNIGIAKAFKIWGNNVINFAVTHQTGEADVELVRAEYAGLPLRAEVVPFIDDIAAALGRADLVVARAGAMTVTDIALAGCPAVFVPYPFHRDRQQEHNARVLERVGAAVIVLDDENLAENLVTQLKRLTADRALLAEMGRKARDAARPDAAQRIAQVCFDLVDKRKAA